MSVSIRISFMGEDKGKEGRGGEYVSIISCSLFHADLEDPLDRLSNNEIPGTGKKGEKKKKGKEKREGCWMRSTQAFDEHPIRRAKMAADNHSFPKKEGEKGEGKVRRSKLQLLSGSRYKKKINTIPPARRRKKKKKKEKGGRRKGQSRTFRSDINLVEQKIMLPSKSLNAPAFPKTCREKKKRGGEEALQSTAGNRASRSPPSSSSSSRFGAMRRRKGGNRAESLGDEEKRAPEKIAEGP